jgi:hypothetical protein
MLDKKAGYAYYRPFYNVDTNAQIYAGMVAFLATSGTTTVATVAASGTVPIGTFWKDRANVYVRSTVESTTFSATTGLATLQKGNVLSTASIKVTDTSGTVVYTQGLDYTVNTVNGLLQNLAGTGIAAGATVIVWYNYSILATQIYWDNVSTKWSSGSNYDRQPDDTQGSGKITVAEGDAKIYTDMYDVTQTYTLNHWLRPDANSLWTTAVTGYSICGRVIQVPTTGNPFLGVQQIMVAS